MTPGGGGGGGIPAEWAAAAVRDLAEVREGLQSFPATSPADRALMEGILNKLSRAMSALDTAGEAAGGGQASAAWSVEPVGPAEATSAGRRAAAAGPERRGSSRRRSTQGTTVTSKTLDDGHSWRKYGQKGIQNTPYPRSYYRCTHSREQDCKAKRHVQHSEADPSMYLITYLGDHTCRDPSTIPLFIETSAAAGGSPGSANLISFGSTTTMTTTTTTTNEHLMHYYSPLSTSEEVLSSRTPGSSPAAAEQFMQVEQQLAPVAAGSAGRMSPMSSAAGSAPEYWNAGGAGSFPSSPSSSLCGFMAGSLGSIGDDDMFDFDL